LAVKPPGSDTLEELRPHIRNRLEESESTQIEGDYRQAVLDSAVANATVEVPEALVEARARELFNEAVHSLSHRGISKDLYLQISGKTEDELVEEGKPEAEQALKREAVLTAIVAAEKIEVADDEVLEALGAETDKPKKLLEQLKNDGRLDQVKEDLAARKAVDLLVESAQAISVDQAVHSLSHRGISKDIYLQISGKSEEELVEEGKPDAEQALKRDAVLTAIVAAENVEVSDEEVLEALGAETDKPKKLLEQLKSDGRLDQVKEDLAARKAVDLLVESAQAISVDQAKADGKLFTPEKTEAEQASGAA